MRFTERVYTAVCASMPGFAWCGLGSTHREAGRAVGTVTCNSGDGKKGTSHSVHLHQQKTYAHSYSHHSPFNSIFAQPATRRDQQMHNEMQWASVMRVFLKLNYWDSKLDLLIGTSALTHTISETLDITGTASYSPVLYPTWCCMCEIHCGAVSDSPLHRHTGNPWGKNGASIPKALKVQKECPHLTEGILLLW